MTGSSFFIARSVFKPAQLPSLREARGEAYFLLHSPEDKVCPYRMARQAEAVLKKAGAEVRLVTYPGGRGWKGNVYGLLREGLAWLDEHNAAPDKKMWPAARSRKRKP